MDSGTSHKPLSHQYLMQAIVNIISNPVNSTVPIVAEVFKAAGVYDPKKVLIAISIVASMRTIKVEHDF